ncbi:MAG: CinA family nicotinamide mononucleotide deamidase-related protein, partial [Pseudomonadota bacterium]
LAQSLKDIGLVPSVKLVVGDEFSTLVTSIKNLSLDADVLIVNGGLGPTVDDLTATALASATEVEIERHPEAMAHLEKWADSRGFEVTPANLKQADLPTGADVIANPYGSAVGFEMMLNECQVICTPGVPGEFKPMVESHVIPAIRQLGELPETSQITRMRFFGITESGMQDLIDEAFPDWPSDVELGFRVQLPVLELKVKTIGADNAALNRQWSEKLLNRFSDYFLGYDNTRLPEALNDVLRTKRLKIATAESCTGGSIAASITSEPGSSDVFEAGFVTYSNPMKTEILGVPEATLIEFGAVSDETVRAMVQGALRVSNADVAIAVSGIAGPGGGSEEKPVGAAFVAFGTRKELQVRKFFLPVRRTMFQNILTAICLDLVRRYVAELPVDVDYYGELRKRQG